MTRLLHAIFVRPERAIKVFDGVGKIAALYHGEGDAIGYTPEAPYGHLGWCPPGHYVLGAPQRFESPIASEGFGQIPIVDLTSDVAEQLVSAGKAKWSGLDLIIGGIGSRIGQLATYGRSDIFAHGGGSNAVDPYADYQELCKTEGCTRMWNLEWRRFADWLDANRGENTVVYSILGDPVRLPK